MAKRAAAVRCVSVGYQGRRLDEFCELLVRTSVPLLVDVRDRAWSNRPEFRKEALRTALRKHGISYLHLKVAGNPMRPKKGEPRDWAKCEAAYTEHLAGHPEVLNELHRVLAETPGAAVFCYEADRQSCHRGVLLRKLDEERPVKVRDL